MTPENQELLARLAKAFGATPDPTAAALGLSADQAAALLLDAVQYPCDKAAPALVRVLLAAGADPNVRQADGRTPLHLAARRGHLGLVQLLLMKGAEVSAATPDGRRPLDEVNRDAHLPTYRLLEGWC